MSSYKCHKISKLIHSILPIKITSKINTLTNFPFTNFPSSSSYFNFLSYKKFFFRYNEQSHVKEMDSLMQLLLTLGQQWKRIRKKFFFCDFLISIHVLYMYAKRWRKFTRKFYYEIFTSPPLYFLIVVIKFFKYDNCWMKKKKLKETGKMKNSYLEKKFHQNFIK